MTIFTVTTTDDSGTGSLRDDLGQAQNGDTINFDPSVKDIYLASTLTIATNVTIEGHQGGGVGPAGVTINGQNAVTDLTVNTGVTATLDGLVIENGHGSGAADTPAAGGVFDAGSLSLSNVVLNNNTATGGDGSAGDYGKGGQPGASAAGGVYVSATGTLHLSASVSASGNSANGGAGGQGGYGSYGSGASGGQGAHVTTSHTADTSAYGGDNGYSFSNAGGTEEPLVKQADPDLLIVFLDITKHTKEPAPAAAAAAETPSPMPAARAASPGLSQRRPSTGPRSWRGAATRSPTPSKLQRCMSIPT